MCLQPIFKNYKFGKTTDFKYEIDFKSTGLIRYPGEKAIAVPCRNCPQCMQQASNEWATRCAMELRHHEDNCIITLTYANTDGELVKADYQCFLKRLRKKIAPAKIKYFISGEYGTLRGRPHYHIIIFGWRPKRVTYYRTTKSGTELYYSFELAELWPHGLAFVDLNPTRKSCFYSAKYLQKLISAKGGLGGKQPPFIHMSNGIAYNEAASYNPNKDPYVYFEGKRIRAPRYFLKVFRKLDGESVYEQYVFNRERTARRIDPRKIPLYMLRRDKRLFDVQKKARRSDAAKIEQFYKKIGLRC